MGFKRKTVSIYNIKFWIMGMIYSINVQSETQASLGTQRFLLIIFRSGGKKNKNGHILKSSRGAQK